MRTKIIFTHCWAPDRLHVDELIEKSGFEAKKVMAVLTRLEMKDMVRPDPGRILYEEGLMAKSLLVVESPTKMKTLSKFLGKDYVIRATYGHIKDLPKSKMGVDVDHGFKPQFAVVKGKAKIVAEIKKASKEADNIYIGSDPDREGEAIAFHVAEEIGKAPVKRVLFNEITKKAVLEAMKSPQDLDESKYDAQKARSILDRLVGYEISPLLWERVKYGLSAGRVQSVALKLVCEREDEIEAFVKEEYWTIEAELTLATGETVKAKLERIDGAEGADSHEGGGGKAQGCLEGQAVHRRGDRGEGAVREPLSALQDEHPPAGGFEQTQVLAEKDHAPGPEALRGRGDQART